MGKYKYYHGETNKKASQKYRKEKCTVTTVVYKNEEYSDYISKAVELSGLPRATFFKQAILEKIEKEYPELKYQEYKDQGGAE